MESSREAACRRASRLGRGVTLAVVMLGAMGAGSAAATLRMEAGTSTPASIAFPGPAALVYTLQLAADGQDETFALQFHAPFFGVEQNGTAPVGASLEYTGQQPRIDGPAHLGAAAASAGDLAGCGPSMHGFGPHSRTWDVRVPAGTTSTLSFDFRPAPSSPWPDTDYDVIFKALPRLVAGGRGTIASARQIIVFGPSTSGSRGVHVTLHSTPETVPLGWRGVARVTSGRRIAIRGATRPRLVGKNVGLWVRTNAKPWFRLGRMVRTDRHGRFRSAVRARRGLQVMARVSAPGAGFAPDYTCPLGFEVRR